MVERWRTEGRQAMQEAMRRGYKPLRACSEAQGWYGENIRWARLQDVDAHLAGLQDEALLRERREQAKRLRLRNFASFWLARAKQPVADLLQEA
mgnify:CR=1